MENVMGQTSNFDRVIKCLVLASQTFILNVKKNKKQNPKNFFTWRKKSARASWHMHLCKGDVICYQSRLLHSLTPSQSFVLIWHCCKWLHVGKSSDCLKWGRIGLLFLHPERRNLVFWGFFPYAPMFVTISLEDKAWLLMHSIMKVFPYWSCF